MASESVLDERAVLDRVVDALLELTLPGQDPDLLQIGDGVDLEAAKTDQPGDADVGRCGFQIACVGH